MDSFANPQVLEFYKSLPFNLFGSVEAQAASVVKAKTAIEANVPLVSLLPTTRRVLDVGCGAGWFVNAVSFHFHAEAVGIDFNPVAVERARAVASHLGLRSDVFHQDLFLFEPAQKFDLVVCLGVLHHTDNCLMGLRHLIEATVEPGGHLYIGLYHRYGRAPFLRYFRDLKESGASEDLLFAKYRELHSSLTDDLHARSWFRDQVLHPHESQHTLDEVMGTLQDLGVTLVSTSINRFQPFDDLGRLYAMEPQYEQHGEEALARRRYFPGFFTSLLRRN